MKRTAALLLLILLLLAGCQDGPPNPSVRLILPGDDTSPTPTPSANIVLPAGPARSHTFGLPWSETLPYRPLLDKLRYNDEWSKLCYEGLFALDEAFDPQPLLCSAWSTADNQTYLLTLRQDVLFHNGASMTANDVIYSLGQAMLEMSPYADRFTLVSSVSAIDDQTVEIVLSSAQDRFVALLDFPIVPANEAASDFSPGTGPYAVRFEEESPYLLAFSDWWRHQRLPLSRVDLTPVSGQDDLVYSFQNGMVGLMTLDLFDPVAPGLHASMETWDIPTTNMVFIGVNTAKAPLDNPEVRAALASALDRAGLTELAYGGFAAPTANPAPPASARGKLLTPSPTNSSDTIMLRLLELGFSDDDADGVLEYSAGRNRREPFLLDLVVNAESDARIVISEQYAQTLRALGIQVSVKKLSYPDYLAALGALEYDLYVGETKLPADFSLKNLLAADGLWNYPKFADEELDARLAALALAPPETELYAAQRVYNRLFETQPFMVVCFRSKLACTQRGKISGLTPTASNAFYNWPNWLVTE